MILYNTLPVSYHIRYHLCYCSQQIFPGSATVLAGSRRDARVWFRPPGIGEVARADRSQHTIAGIVLCSVEVYPASTWRRASERHTPRSHALPAGSSVATPLAAPAGSKRRRESCPPSTHPSCPPARPQILSTLSGLFLVHLINRSATPSERSFARGGVSQYAPSSSSPRIGHCALPWRATLTTSLNQTLVFEAGMSPVGFSRAR